MCGEICWAEFEDNLIFTKMYPFRCVAYKYKLENFLILAACEVELWMKNNTQQKR